MRIAILFLTFLFLFTGVGSVFASFSFSISDVDTATISSLDQIISVNLSITDLPSGDSYFRVALQKDNNTYFGYLMNNNGVWNPIPSLTSDDCSGYHKISDTPTTSVTLKFKVGSDTQIDNGIYNLKAHRFTSTCKTYKDASNNSSYTITINKTTPTPSPTPTPTPSPTSTPTATAATSTSQFTISDIPAQINSDQSFSTKITLSMPNNPSTIYYLKGAFKIKDGSRYFGLTKKDSEWIEYGDDYSDQLKITTDSSGNWSGNLEVKPDTFDKDYKGSGEYIFKVAKITSLNYSSWSNEASIKITSIAAPTTSQPTPTNSSSPAKSSVPSSTPTSTSTPKAYTKPSANDNNNSASVAGINTEEVTNEPETKKGSINFLSIFGIIMILAGASLLGYILLKTTGMIDLLLKLWKR